MAGAHVSLSDMGLCTCAEGPGFVTLVPQSVSAVLGVCVGSGLAGAHGDPAGAVTQAAAASEPSSSSWLLAGDMAGQHSACATTVALGCCLLAGSWIVGARGHRVPTRWGSLGMATHRPSPQ